jgi:N-acetylglucosaminyl-diphospho-decaprenol L-rhamnosyltransferase
MNLLHNNKKKIIIGFIIFGQNTSKYLPYFLPSLKNQNFKDYKIIVFNNGAIDDDNIKYLRENYPDIEVAGDGANHGFAYAYNRMIAKAFDERADYFLMTNPDIVFEPDVLEKLSQRLDADRELGSVCPRILKWNFSENKKTNSIDSYGVGLKNGLRFFDVGQGREDDKRFRYTSIIGPSGACGLFRMAALERIKEQGKYLDERMFMYKEDCDLDYRLFLVGQESACVPEAAVYHDRTASGLGIGDLAAISARKNKSREVKHLSLINQQLIFKKYWQLQSFSSRLCITVYMLKSFFYSLIFERYLLKDFLAFFKNKA